MLALNLAGQCLLTSRCVLTIHDSALTQRAARGRLQQHDWHEARPAAMPAYSELMACTEPVA